jgi:membrane protein implicated in regulation of membrane protease activity
MTKSGPPRMMLVLLGATGVVVAAVAALAVQSWWVLIAVLAVHATATTLVVMYTLRQAGRDYDKPDPVSEAQVEDERASSPRPRRRRARDYQVFN